MKNHKNQPGIMKNQLGTIKNHENLPATINKQKRYKQTDRQTEPSYLFAKSDLDLSIDFFSYLYCIFQIILLPNIMFYPIITTLDGGGGSGQE